MTQVRWDHDRESRTGIPEVIYGPGKTSAHLRQIFENAQELRMALRRVPLVILTGVADPRHEADRCNAEAYLSKPFDAQELVNIVRRFAA